MSITNIADLVQDSNNLNLGTESGQKLLEHSIEEVGFGRSIVTDKDGNILAGNKTQLAAVAKGKQKVIVVDSDGESLIVHRRTDLAAGTPRATKLAILDNRTNQMNLRWREDATAQIEEAGISIEEVGFTEPTINDPSSPSGSDGPSSVGEAFSVVVECRDEQQQQEVYERLTGEGLKCRVLTL